MKIKTKTNYVREDSLSKPLYDGYTEIWYKETNIGNIDLRGTTESERKAIINKLIESYHCACSNLTQ